MSSTAEEDFQQLLSSIHTIQLSSITSDSLPNISYAPYVRDEQGAYYIFISQLASHTQDLLDNPVAAILLAEDEQNTRQIFARTRVTYFCRVEIVNVKENNYPLILDKFSEEFGSVISLLKGLPDFILFRLVPESGRFVKGFGQAYELEGENLQELRHIRKS